MYGSSELNQSIKSIARTEPFVLTHWDDPCKASPCRSRDDWEQWWRAGDPCPLLPEYKYNDVCVKCGLIPGNDGPVLSPEKIIDEIENGLLDRTQATISKGPREIHQCKFPDCEAMVIKYDFCAYHGSTVANRKQSYKKRFGMDAIAPDEYLYMPIISYSDNPALKNRSDPYLCDWQGEGGPCETYIRRGRFCTTHGKIVWGRSKKWRKDGNEGPAPDDIIFAPIQRRNYRKGLR